MKTVSLCASCKNGFKCEIGGGDESKTIKIKVKCLEYPKAFDNLMSRAYKYTDPFPYIKKCTHYIKRKEIK